MIENKIFMFFLVEARCTANRIEKKNRTRNTRDINYAMKIEETMISINFLGHRRHKINRKSTNKSQMSGNIK